jgi:hypothetical protein
LHELRQPPVRFGCDGIRRVGVELEYGGLKPAVVAEMVRELYGGRVEDRTTNACSVESTKFGSFTVKLDWRFAHLVEIETLNRAAQGDPLAKASSAVEHALGKLGSLLMPYEIAAPPIPFDQLPELERLVSRLRAAGAEDTRADWLHAYALQLNPEAPSLEASGILAMLRAYVLMSGWLREQIQVDVTRRVAGYIDPYPEAFVRTVLDQHYRPELAQLMDDYIAANPTRNRELDLLPLFAYLDEPRVRRRLDDERIRPRPTYHYRLPDCRLRDRDWGVVLEWNRWVEVERLAADPPRLAELTQAFFHAGRHEPPWADIVQRSVSKGSAPSSA